eukprot:8838895-Pyramimonas_sp.AAC.1
MYLDRGDAGRTRGVTEGGGCAPLVVTWVQRRPIKHKTRWYSYCNPRIKGPLRKGPHRTRPCATTSQVRPHKRLPRARIP